MNPLARAALVVLLAGFLSYRLEKPATDVEIDLHEDLAHPAR